MALYETLFITPPTLSEEDEASTVEALLDVVRSGGGELVANERMGRRRLAYPIKKHEDGVYVRFLYDSGSAVAEELERRIRLSDQVLRSLTVVLEREWAEDARKRAIEDAQRREEQKAEEARKAAEEAAKPKEEAPEADAEASAPESTTEAAPESSEPAASTEPAAATETKEAD